jgi:hypothetical protein
MGPPALSEAELDTVRRCVIAILEGPFIDDWEFQTRLGVDRAALSTILTAQAFLDNRSKDSIVQMAIHNCMNEVSNGVSISPAEWDRWFVVSRQEVQTTFLKWSALNP